MIQRIRRRPSRCGAMCHAITVALLAVVLRAGTVSAQTPAQTAQTEQAEIFSPLPPPPPRKPFGQVKVGSLTLTPSGSIAAIGIDTNVQDAEGRHSDFMIAVGPSYKAEVKSSRLDISAL